MWLLQWLKCQTSEDRVWIHRTPRALQMVGSDWHSQKCIPMHIHNLFWWSCTASFQDGSICCRSLLVIQSSLGWMVQRGHNCGRTCSGDSGSLVSYVPPTTEAFWLISYWGLRRSLGGKKKNGPPHLIFLNLYESNECLSPHTRVVSSWMFVYFSMACRRWERISNTN